MMFSHVGKATLVLASAGEGSGYGPWAWDHSGWYWPMMGIHGLLWLLIVGLIVAALVLLVRGLVRGPSASESPGAAAGEGGSARAVLDARYARGDIDRDDYRHRKQDLS